MNEIFLSVIIPCYNTEFTLFQKCIDSIRPIKVSMEVIVVDDGSREECREKYVDYIDNDVRFRWIQKENGGVSSARNRGILEARGRYLCFVDADDEIKKEFVHFINERNQEIEADWVLFDIEVYDVNNQQFSNRKLFKKYSLEMGEKENIYSLDYLEVLDLRAMSTELSECWAKLVLRKLVIEHKIEFPMGVLTSEDRIFNTRLLKVSRDIQYVPFPAYRYNYVPRIAERILEDPYKRYKHLELEKDGLKELIEEKAEICDKERYLKEQKVYLIHGIVQDCLIFESARKLDGRLKAYLQKWVMENGLFQNIGLRDFRGFKRKLYFMILRYRMWIVIKVISYIKRGIQS